MIDRRKRPNGAWEYRDEGESCFVFDMWSSGVSIDSIDDFIESGALPDWVREELQEIRSDALSAYLSKDFELAFARATALHWACRFYGQTIAGTPRVRDSERRSEEQRKRRIGKPATNSYDANRNSRIRAFYERQIAAHADNPIQTTAHEFDLSTRQIRRIVSGK